jgi:hypothetical protein
MVAVVVGPNRSAPVNNSRRRLAAIYRYDRLASAIFGMRVLDKLQTELVERKSHGDDAR